MPRPAPIANLVQTLRARGTRTAWILAAASASTALAWLALEPTQAAEVQIGDTLTKASVLRGYQLSVFPALGAFVGALALDASRAQDPRSLRPRAVLVASAVLLSIGRLAGALPLCGHALALFAILGYELAPPSSRDAHLSLALAVPALLVVGWCKLVVWGDPAWFGLSAALGLAIGTWLARRARA
jgi:hypothetical protein